MPVEGNFLNLIFQNSLGDCVAELQEKGCIFHSPGSFQSYLDLFPSHLDTVTEGTRDWMNERVTREAEGALLILS